MYDIVSPETWGRRDKWPNRHTAVMDSLERRFRKKGAATRRGHCEWMQRNNTSGITRTVVDWKEDKTNQKEKAMGAKVAAEKRHGMHKANVTMLA